MFSRAVAVATRFTFPFIGLRRSIDGNVFTNVGAFVLVNREGWILTSAHILDEIAAREHERTRLEEGSIPEASRSRAVSDRAEVWAVPGFAETRPGIIDVTVNAVADLGVARLDPFDPASFKAAPVFRDPKRPIAQGESVCRLGFPFHDVSAQHTPEDGFTIASSAFPVPLFALDGIVARFNRMSSADETALFIETSTPGLRGQSGGPLLDVDGRVCGIQSHTSHLDLGFDARYLLDDQVVVERQFLNVGAASHADETTSLLRAVGADFILG